MKLNPLLLTAGITAAAAAVISYPVAARQIRDDWQGDSLGDPSKNGRQIDDVQLYTDAQSRIQSDAYLSLGLVGVGSGLAYASFTSGQAARIARTAGEHLAKPPHAPILKPFGLAALAGAFAGAALGLGIGAFASSKVFESQKFAPAG